jgi:hypothetical protein
MAVQHLANGKAEQQIPGCNSSLQKACSINSTSLQVLLQLMTTERVSATVNCLQQQTKLGTISYDA